MIAAPAALAQTERMICPELDASESPEKQAVCWFNRDQRDEAGCAAEKHVAGVCALQAASWCSKSVLDDAEVANACYLAYVRTRQFDEALSIERYLQTPPVEVTKCLQSLQAIDARFVSTPSDAELLIDGQSYGTTPVQVKLRGEWWKRKATVRFGTVANPSDVEISQKDLIAAFDSRSCTMADILVSGPGASPLSEEPDEASIASPGFIEAVDNEPTDEPAGLSALDVVLVSAGGVGIITGAILLGIAASSASDLSSPEARTTWTTDLRDRNDMIEPLSIAGAVTLGAGAVLATIAIISFATDSDSSLPDSSTTARSLLRLARRELHWIGRF